MADVRALLAAERQARRISHPHLQYTKSGVLLCTVCNLNVKSEALWDGHLRSANHRKNTLASQEATNKPLKRKIDHVDIDIPKEDARHYPEAEARKKPKAALEPVNEAPKAADGSDDLPSTPLDEEEEELTVLHHPIESDGEHDAPPDTTTRDPHSSPITNRPKPVPEVDEDEWAAFEREVAPLASEQPRPQASNYEGATISAAPVSAAQLAEQASDDRRTRLETEAQDEKEDEERRLEEEFDVMEEMEERVRRLKEKREALRNAVQKNGDTEHTESVPVNGARQPGVDGDDPEANATGINDANDDEDNEHDEDEEDDDEDDWYQ